MGGGVKYTGIVGTVTHGCDGGGGVTLSHQLSHQLRTSVELDVCPLHSRARGHCLQFLCNAFESNTCVQ